MSLGTVVLQNGGGGGSHCRGSSQLQHYLTLFSAIFVQAAEDRVLQAMTSKAAEVVCVCVHVSTCVYHMCMCTCMSTFVYMCVHVYMYTHVCTCVGMFV